MLTVPPSPPVNPACAGFTGGCTAVSALAPASCFAGSQVEKSFRRGLSVADACISCSRSVVAQVSMARHSWLDTNRTCTAGCGPTSDKQGMRRIVKLVSKHQQPAADLAFWLSRPMAERMAAVEALRVHAMNPPGSFDVEPRLQRVCRVAERQGR